MLKLFCAVVFFLTGASALSYSPVCSSSDVGTVEREGAFNLECARNGGTTQRRVKSCLTDTTVHDGHLIKCDESPEGFILRNEVCVIQRECKEPVAIAYNGLTACQPRARPGTWTWSPEPWGSRRKGPNSFVIECRQTESGGFSTVRPRAIACIDASGNRRENGDEWVEGTSDAGVGSYKKRCLVTEAFAAVQFIACVDPETKEEKSNGEPWVSSDGKKLLACHVNRLHTEESSVVNIPVVRRGERVREAPLGFYVVDSSGDPVACIDNGAERVGTGSSWRGGSIYRTCDLDRTSNPFVATGCYDPITRRNVSEGEKWLNVGFEFQCDLSDPHAQKLVGCLDEAGNRVKPEEEFRQSDVLRICQGIVGTHAVRKVVACVDEDGKRVEPGESYKWYDGLRRCGVGPKGEDSYFTACRLFGETVRNDTEIQRGAFSFRCLLAPGPKPKTITVQYSCSRESSENQLLDSSRGLLGQCEAFRTIGARRLSIETQGCARDFTGPLVRNGTHWNATNEDGQKFERKCEFRQFRNRTTGRSMTKGGIKASACFIPTSEGLKKVKMGCYEPAGDQYIFCRPITINDDRTAVSGSVERSPGYADFLQKILKLRDCSGSGIGGISFEQLLAILGRDRNKRSVANMAKEANYGEEVRRLSKRSATEQTARFGLKDVVFK